VKSSGGAVYQHPGWASGGNSWPFEPAPKAACKGTDCVDPHQCHKTLHQPQKVNTEWFRIDVRIRKRYGYAAMSLVVRKSWLCIFPPDKGAPVGRDMEGTATLGGGGGGGPGKINNNTVVGQ